MQYIPCLHCFKECTGLPCWFSDLTFFHFCLKISSLNTAINRDVVEICSAAKCGDQPPARSCELLIMLFPRSLHSSLVSWVIVTVGFVFGGGKRDRRSHRQPTTTPPPMAPISRNLPCPSGPRSMGTGSRPGILALFFHSGVGKEWVRQKGTGARPVALIGQTKAALCRKRDLVKNCKLGMGFSKLAQLVFIGRSWLGLLTPRAELSPGRAPKSWLLMEERAKAWLVVLI